MMYEFRSLGLRAFSSRRCFRKCRFPLPLRRKARTMTRLALTACCDIATEAPTQGIQTMWVFGWRWTETCLLSIFMESFPENT